jgi:hypothetical protein
MSKNMPKYGILCILLLLYAAVAAAQHNMAELRPVLDKLKALKHYAYESHARVVFPNGQQDELVTRVCMDRNSQRMFYSNKGELLLLNKTWVCKLNHTRAIAQVFKLSAYQAKHKGSLGDLQGLFRIDMSALFIDSVIAQKGRLTSVERKDGLVTYKVLFPGEASLKEFLLVYNEQKQLPERIFLKMAQQGASAASSEVVCSGYTTDIPDSVFDERNYFTIQKGRPVLRQYKNYKVYSAL